MGIRFERGSRRTTNGPLIFFSIYHDQEFEELIRSAFLSGLSFYAYRFPNDSMLSFGVSEEYVEGLDTPGFVIGLFDSSKPVITIPYGGVKNFEALSSLYDPPLKSTSFQDYSHEVDEIIKDLEGRHDSKVVAARVCIKDNRIDVAERFYGLCQKFPDAFIFCFSTPPTGCWIGASPELLLESKNGMLHSMALAGTRREGSEEAWDKKNIEEQEIVADYICETFTGSGLVPVREKTFTESTGKIEHICTPIYAAIPETEFNLQKFLKSLYPTPALCGYPKEFALQEIKRLENFDRGCYGGFCGPYHSMEDFRLNVVLRCGYLTEKNIYLYAGGGITSLSDIESEWEETTLKINNTFPD